MSGGGLFSDTGGIGGMMSGMGEGLGINLSGIPFIGGLFPNPAEKAMRDSLANAVTSYGNMREPQAQGYQNLMGRVGQSFAPVQSALSWMYGGPDQGGAGGGSGQAPSGPPPPQMGTPLAPAQSAPQQSPGGSFGALGPFRSPLGGAPGGGGGGGLAGMIPGFSGGGLPGLPRLPGLPGGGGPPDVPGMPSGLPGMGGLPGMSGSPLGGLGGGLGGLLPGMGGGNGGPLGGLFG
jgi:hypothetical protein